jgi:hypothetical protein
VNEAHEGIRSGYARDPGEVAALLAIHTGDPALWGDILAAVQDMSVSADHKAGLLERLALNASAIPPTVVHGIRECAESLIEQPRSVTPMSFDARAPFPEAVRLAAGLGVLRAEDVLPKVTAMASDSTAAIRREASRTIPPVIDGTDAVDWGQVLLMQLSRDPDLVVRGDAVRSLVMSLPTRSNLTGAVSQRVVEILTSDSIRMPLFALHGFQALAADESTNAAVAAFEPHISDLANSHPSSTVRGAAKMAMSPDFSDS